MPWARQGPHERGRFTSRPSPRASHHVGMPPVLSNGEAVDKGSWRPQTPLQVLVNNRKNRHPFLFSTQQDKMKRNG